MLAIRILLGFWNLLSSDCKAFSFCSEHCWLSAAFLGWSGSGSLGLPESTSPTTTCLHMRPPQGSTSRVHRVFSSRLPPQSTHSLPTQEGIREQGRTFGVDPGFLAG